MPHRGHKKGREDLETIVNIEDLSRRSALYGPADRNLRLIRAAFDVRISARDGVLRISGPAEAVAKAAHCLQQLQRALRTCPSLSDDQVKEVIYEARASGDLPEAVSEISVYLPSAHIAPKGEGQRTYVEAIRNHDLTFCLGPAGTGKTYLAVAMAVSLLKNNKIKRIVLARPAVEAGEKLGYLPGDMQAKVNPYLRPLFDAMHDMMTFDQIKRFMQNDVIEVIPLAFMRGRTLNHSAIILDEAQNSTPMQMLMFLTRLGHHSKMIVTGDDSQSDLGAAEKSGFVDAVARLRNVQGVAVLRLTRRDIVRHPLVQKVVEVYGDKTGRPPPPSDKS
jgi:phosphate starvation-inducible PhoH-like protein